MKNGTMLRVCLMGCTVPAAAGILPPQAAAQDSRPSANPPNSGLQEIVVTAQKREQSLQDVPIAVTAVTAADIQANRISTVNDLSAIAPGVTVRPSAGGIQTPFFTIRGQVSEGVVAGSDKEASIYLDGVYISSPRGSIFDLPDVRQLEVLRGPQGTLFGRNATAGAISVTTRDPSGTLGVKIGGSYGNYDSYRARVTIDTPEVAGFSALFSFQRNYQRGDIRNLAAGTVWDRTNSPSGYGVARSPTWLGTIDSNSYFAAVKYEPVDNFRLVYKYDRNDDSGTPDGTAIVAYDKSGLLGSVLTALYTSNNVPFDTSGTRPDAVSNGWVVPRQQTAQGHNLTATWEPADHVTVKNIAAYRDTSVFSPSAIDGVSSLTFTQATVQPFALLTAYSSVPNFQYYPPAVQGSILAGIAAQLQPLATYGYRVIPVASQASSISKQYSDELQANYSSSHLHATLGALWFHTSEQSGGPIGQENTITFGTFIPPTGVIPLANEGRSFNTSTSLAAYTQLEYKFTPTLEAVSGVRITYDKKDSTLRYDINSPATGLIVPTTLFTPPAYKKTKPSYMAGLNWTPRRGLLIYGKYSNSFVTGGTTYGIAYAPEVASSEELGMKGDFLDRRLRLNLALYHVIYSHAQQPQGTEALSSQQICTQSLTPLDGATNATQLCQYAISTFVFDVGTLRSQGFEAEVTAAPAARLLVGGSLAYSGNKYTYISPIVLAANGGDFLPIDRPAWTGSLYTSYETRPIVGDVTAQLRVDGLYQSSQRFQSLPSTLTSAGGFLYADGSNAVAVGTGGYVLVNARASLRHVKFGTAGAELAFWGKNLTDRKNASFALEASGLSTSENFIPPRTYGVDLDIQF
jgi:iron complex outermembrane receptor protein